MKCAICEKEVDKLFYIWCDNCYSEHIESEYNEDGIGSEDDRTGNE